MIPGARKSRNRSAGGVFGERPLEPAANDATSEILGTDGQPNVSDTKSVSAEPAVLGESGRADDETIGTKPDARDMPPLQAADE